MKTIVVPIDGSSLSKNALTFAITMAKAYGDQIRVVNVQPYHDILGETIIKEATALLEKEDVPHSSTVRIGAPPSIEIISEAKDENVRCIVIGSKGSGNTTNHIGSVSLAVLQMAKCPVVVIPS